MVGDCTVRQSGRSKVGTVRQGPARNGERTGLQLGWKGQDCMGVSLKPSGAGMKRQAKVMTRGSEKQLTTDVVRGSRTSGSGAVLK